MKEKLVTSKVQFGTAAVFMTAISTILGAVMFLRFGYAVGNVGFFGTLMIIVIGHLITIPTAMALAEIATNQKVEGGGEYFIISRSFGLNSGAAIGLALFFSQAISVAFYIIAFAQAFDPVINFLQVNYNFMLDKRMISLIAMAALTTLMLTRGAGSGIKALYGVVGLLFLSIVFFFFGSPITELESGITTLTDTVANPDDFFLVFAICFPAFTGMTAGVGLSGDLKNPKKSIPIGTLSATLIGMIIYVLIAYKLSMSASAQELVGDQLIMSRIALWGPIIPLGLAAATISSALGSIMVAPRTLQALAGDGIFPSQIINKWLSLGKANTNEPTNASLVTCLIAFFFIAIGDVDFVAQIISMFFMVTYGSICFISFLEHFAADPSYRPAFKSKWYLSLLGTILCVWLMFKMNPGYAFLSISFMIFTFIGISYYLKDRQGMTAIFQGAIFQLSRGLQVFLQKAKKENIDSHWRPSIICLSSESFERFAAYDLLRWISHRYGFGTHIHLIKDYLSKESHNLAKADLGRLIKIGDISKSNVFVDTLVSPSITSAITQIIQLPGISGKENNMILFEYPKDEPDALNDIVDNFKLIFISDFDFCVLGTSDRGFGYKREIHIWITSKDYENANLMILLSYIILGHPDWKDGEIKIFALFPESELVEQKEYLLNLAKTGRLPISPNNIVLVEQKSDMDAKQIINDFSTDADLTIIGIRGEQIKATGRDMFLGYDKISNVLFINSTREKQIE